MNRPLSENEQLAFAGLVRALVRLEGGFSAAERKAIEDVGAELFLAHPGHVPYRSAPADDTIDDMERKLAVEALWAALDRAGQTFDGDEAIKQAALGVTDPAARAAIADALVAIASADSIDDGEQSLLDWVNTAWALK
jgi:hypothetical protein